MAIGPLGPNGINPNAYSVGYDGEVHAPNPNVPFDPTAASSFGQQNADLSRPADAQAEKPKKHSPWSAIGRIGLGWVKNHVPVVGNVLNMVDAGKDAIKLTGMLISGKGTFAEKAKAATDLFMHTKGIFNRKTGGRYDVAQGQARVLGSVAEKFGVSPDLVNVAAAGYGIYKSKDRGNAAGQAGMPAGMPGMPGVGGVGALGAGLLSAGAMGMGGMGMGGMGMGGIAGPMMSNMSLPMSQGGFGSQMLSQMLFGYSRMGSSMGAVQSPGPIGPNAFGVFGQAQQL